MKKRLTTQQEFEIMKLVLDKFLWIGTAIMGWGLYKLFAYGWSALQDAVLLFITGSIVLVVFMILIVKEYEIIG